MRAIVIPTRNEADNIEPLLDRLAPACRSRPAQVLIVDDSDDGTEHEVERWSRRNQDALDVQVLHRRPEARQGGLGGAVLAGLRTIRSHWACVMDADLQHPPEAVPLLFAKAEAGGADLVIGTRPTRGRLPTGMGATRAVASWLATELARRCHPERLGDISDPLSGFFVLHRSVLDTRPGLDVDGFKVLLAILLSGDPLVTAELHYDFGERLAGQSKASAHEALAYLDVLTSVQRRAASLPLECAAGRLGCLDRNRGRDGLARGQPSTGSAPSSSSA